MPDIRTDRLILRAPRMDDAEPLMGVFGDPQAMRFVNHGTTRSIDEVRASLEKKIACLAKHRVTLFTLIERDSGDIIGDCGIIPISWSEPEFELAYRLRPSAWGKGYATEAGVAAMEHAWRETGLDRVFAVTDPDNHASQRVLAKIGFAASGVTDRYYNATLRLFRFDRPAARQAQQRANDPA